MRYKQQKDPTDLVLQRIPCGNEQRPTHAMPVSAPLRNAPVQPRKASAPVVPKNAAPTLATAREAYGKADASFATFMKNTIGVQAAIQESIVQHFGTNALTTGLEVGENQYGGPTTKPRKESTLPDVFCAAHSANSRLRPATHLYAAHSEWRDRIVPFVKIAHTTLEPYWITRLTELGQGIAAGFFLIGHVFKALQVLRDVVSFSENILTRAHLLRWTVRLSEWEMYEEVLKEIQADPKLAEDSSSEFSQILEICHQIQAMHRNPKMRTEFANGIRDKYDAVTLSGKKDFPTYERLALLSFALSFVPKFSEVDHRTDLDAVHCLEIAQSRAMAIVKSRLACFSWDVEMKFPENMKKSEMLKIFSSIAEYFDIARQHTYEMLRSGMLRESSLMATTTPLIALRLGIPFWIVHSMDCAVVVKRSNLIDQADLPLYRKMMAAYMGHPPNAGDESNNVDDDNDKENTPPHEPTPTCMDQLTERLTSLCTPGRFRSRQSDLHGGSTSDCECATCFEAAQNPLYSFEIATAKLVYSEYDMREMRSVMADFARLRASLAPLQLTLMGMDGKPAKPRPPLFLVESATSAVVAFLLSPTGQALGPDDHERTELIANALKICSYASTLCVHAKLVLRSLQRNYSARPPNYVWLEKTSVLGNIKTMLTPTRSTAGTSSSTTPSRRTARTPRPEVPGTTAKEMHAEWKAYAHLMYREWRVPQCWSLAMESPCEWLRAMLIAETFGLGTRQARRYVDRLLMPFGFSSAASFKSVVREIPKNMTVIQLAISSSGHLYLCKLHATRDPITIPLAGREKWSSALEDVKKAIAKCEETAEAGKNNTDAQAFWEGRRKAEEFMKMTIEDLEESLLGPFTPLVLPSMELTSAGEAAARRMIHPPTEGKSEDAKNGRLKETLARELISIFIQITADRWKELIARLRLVYNWSGEQAERLLTFKKRVTTSDAVAWCKETTDEGRFVFFVVPPELMAVQWEMLSVLRDAQNKSVFVHRLVMMHQLFSLLEMRKVPHHANPLNSYYILDPDNDLAASKKRLEPVVNKYNWKGLTGAAPQRDQVQEILNNDFFFFLGHGNGNKFMSRTIVRKSDCRAVVILMGCSSVHTQIEGPGMDGRGVALDYALARCPSVVGCLFMVTDGEIDKYFVALVEELCEEQKKAETARTTRRTAAAKKAEGGADGSIANLRMLHVAMAKAKTRVKLPYLTGNAVVAFGIPVAMQPSVSV